MSVARVAETAARARLTSVGPFQRDVRQELPVPVRCQAARRKEHQVRRRERQRDCQQQWQQQEREDDDRVRPVKPADRH